MTEKQYAPTKTEKKTKVDGTPKQKKIDVPKTKKSVEKKVEKPKEETKLVGLENKSPASPKQSEDSSTKAPGEKVDEKPEIKEDKKVEEKKKPEAKKPVQKVKKNEVVVNIKGVQVSTKYSMAICKFIKHKSIEKAIKDLEEVVLLKKAVPMKGEIPHRKGKIMSGRFPKRAAEKFIMILKSLLGNANNHDVDEPVINEALANMGSRPMGRRGIKRKRTHIIIKAKSKKKTKEKKK